MSDLGSISQYALSIQNMQMSLIKNQVQMQQKMIDVLVENTHNSVPTSKTLGTGIDISV